MVTSFKPLTHLDQHRKYSVILFWLLLAPFLIPIIQLGFWEFVGVDPVWFQSPTPSSSSLSREGIYKIVRHPIYTALLSAVIFGTTYYTVDRIILICGVVAYLFLIGIPYEEERLTETFGDRYIQYQKEVPPFIPTLSSISTLSSKEKAK